MHTHTLTLITADTTETFACTGDDAALSLAYTIARAADAANTADTYLSLRVDGPQGLIFVAGATTDLLAAVRDTVLAKADQARRAARMRELREQYIVVRTNDAPLFEAIGFWQGEVD